MTIALPDATYRGTYFQISLQTKEATLAPLWSGWQPAWSDWPYWSLAAKQRYDVGDFIARYRGKIVANLEAPDGTGMRCRLHLASPVREMAGGGEGECQIAGGETIQVHF